MKAKVAILGCGKASQKWHLPTMRELAKHGELDFVALCDMDTSLAKQTGEIYGVPWYTSVEQMLAKHPDIMAVDVITGGRKDVEMAMAIYESSLNNMAPVKLPIERLTSYERMLHEDYLEKFGQPIDQF